jgi:hypothetical protein
MSRLTVLPFLAALYLASAVLPAPAQPTAAVTLETPPAAHLEVMLSGSKGAAPEDGALDRSLGLLRESAFLDRPAAAVADPLAPCALLTAVVSADLLNRMFFGLIRPGGFDFSAPPGTQILGRYDAVLARAKGAIPRDDPAQAADILARSVVGRSWGISGMMNTVLSSLTQAGCLDMLVRPKLLEEAVEGYTKKARTGGVVMTHAPPVSAYILSVDKPQGDAWFDELLAAGMLDKPSRPAANPLAPCALLGMFRLAARINDAWANALPTGKLDTAGRSALAPYAEALRQPLAAGETGVAKAELLAAVFDAEIRRANWLTGQLSGDVTQRECLDEMFAPGTLRLKLMRAGKTLPLR